MKKNIEDKIRQLNNWKNTGMLLLIAQGFILHYVFEWSHHSAILGLWVPVNESVWEHLKLGYGALTLFTLFEYYFVSNLVYNYFLAKLLGLLILESSILFIYYGYKLFTPHNILVIDISSYIVGAILCQITIHHFYKIKPYHPAIEKFSLIVFLSIGILFAIATHKPLHQPIFLDAKSGTYGIHKTK